MSILRRNTMKKKATDVKNEPASAPKTEAGILAKISFKKTAIAGAAVLLMFLADHLLVSRFTLVDKTVSVFTAILTAIVCVLGFVFTDAVQNAAYKRALKGVAAACLVAFGMETLVFNLKAFTTDTEAKSFTAYESIITEAEDAVTVTPEGIILQKDTTLELNLNQENIGAVELAFRSGTNSTIRCGISMKDHNFSQKYINVGEKQITTDYGKCDFAIAPYEVLQSVKLRFSGISTPVTLYQIQFSKALPFTFSEARFYFVWLILAAIWCIWSLELYKLTYDRTDKRHRMAIYAVTAVCTLSMLVFFNKTAKDIPYDKDGSYGGSDPYVQMFDAFQHHRTSIGIEPSQELLALENPYDDSTRDNVAYAWDRAFFNGKYYSYYGIAPVITFYYPYYYLNAKSPSELPTMNKACVFFGMLSVLFLVGTIMAFVRKFIKKPNLLMLCLFIMASLYASGFYFMVDYSSLYALPGVTGSCYLMLCLWCGLEAYIRRGEKKQPVLFAVSGLAFALCVASKPTRALSCLVLAPAFLEILFSKNRKIKEKVVSAGAFLLPAFAGLGLLMAYNQARFGSPTDFGATYQLTVSNVNANHLRLSYLPDAIIQYFFQPLCLSSRYPFVEMANINMTNRQAYIYSGISIGAFTMPLIAAGLIATPFLLHHQKRAKGEPFAITDTLVKNATYGMMLLIPVFIAWFNYSIAGVILSYVCDILPLLTLLAVFVLLEVQEQVSGIGCLANKTVCLFSCTAVLTMVIGILEMCSLLDTFLYTCHPNLFSIMEDMISFWN